MQNWTILIAETWVVLGEGGGGERARAGNSDKLSDTGRRGVQGYWGVSGLGSSTFCYFRMLRSTYVVILVKVTQK